MTSSKTPPHPVIAGSYESAQLIELAAPSATRMSVRAVSSSYAATPETPPAAAQVNTRQTETSTSAAITSIASPLWRRAAQQVVALAARALKQQAAKRRPK